uniref:Chemokine ligand 36 n=1 Tax=Ctenopharyngodon idella TaxID=7959 RepID=A0A345D709_CTEID|nr:chemokine ligand 36 [Ctenopharyngodon idella]
MLIMKCNNVLCIVFVMLVFCLYANSPDECCFKYYARKIPIAKITSYMETRMDCAKAGIIMVIHYIVYVCKISVLSN